MRQLHDPSVHTAIRARVESLSPSSARRWGKMSIDQMLRHMNIALESALGRVPVARLRIPLPEFLIKWVVLYTPWPRGVITPPEFVAGERYDFETERTRCLALIDELANHPVDSKWPRHHTFGRMTGAETSALHAKHLNHHLRQFSA